MSLTKKMMSISLVFALILGVIGCSDPGKNKPADGKAATGTDGTKAEAKSDYPKKNIRFIVPVSPGGGFDTLSRMFVPFWEKNLPNNAKIVVENKPGGEWAIGLTELFKAPGDGYTVGILNLPGNVTDQILGKSNYDLTKYEYIGRISDVVYVLAVSKKSGIKNFEDYKKAKELKGGVAGLASTSGIGAVIVADKLGIKFTPVPHDGSNEAILSAIRGSVDSVLYPFSSLKKSIIDSDDLTPVAVFAKERHPKLPNIPSIAELGYGDLLDTVQLHRIVAASPGTPADIMKLLRESFDKAVQDPEFKQKMIAEDATFNPANAETAKKIVTSSIKEFQAYKELIEKNRK